MSNYWTVPMTDAHRERMRHAPGACLTCDAATQRARTIALGAKQKAHAKGAGFSTSNPMVAGEGIEPPTRGFSIPCSTN